MRKYECNVEQMREERREKEKKELKDNLVILKFSLLQNDSSIQLYIVFAIKVSPNLTICYTTTISRS